MEYVHPCSIISYISHNLYKLYAQQEILGTAESLQTDRTATV